MMALIVIGVLSVIVSLALGALLRAGARDDQMVDRLRRTGGL